MSSEPSIEPTRSKRRRNLVAIVATLVTLATIGSGARIALDRQEQDRKDQEQDRKNQAIQDELDRQRATWCAGRIEIRKVGDAGECVGISDGSYQFTTGGGPKSVQDEQLRKVQQLIATANQAIGDAPARNIVYLLPMPRHDKDGILPGSAIRQLYGAYAAQQVANEVKGTKIRLLVANTGHHGGEWEKIAGQISGRHNTDRVSVVAGLGPSWNETYKLVEELSQAEIPMVGATFTADDLHGEKYKHLYRVTPRNSEQAAVGIDYLRGISPSATGSQVNRTFLIAARESANGVEDQWVIALETAFAKEFGPNYTLRTFHPDDGLSDGNTGSEVVAIHGAAQDICSQNKDVVVYFAGRSMALQSLIIALSSMCHLKLSVRVMTADDASNLAIKRDPQLQQALERGHVQLYYTGLANPQQWGGPAPGTGTTRGALAAVKQVTGNLGDSALNDGVAMMAFDAVTVAVTAFRRLDAIPHTANERDALTNGFTSMTHGRPACGASGPIGLAPGKNPPAGSAINKPIPVMQLGADLEPQFRALGYPAESDLAYPVSASGGQRRWTGKCGL